MNPILADQARAGMLVISWTERTVRVGLRQQGGCSRYGRTEAAVVMNMKHGSSVQSLAFKWNGDDGKDLSCVPSL